MMAAAITAAPGPPQKRISARTGTRAWQAGVLLVVLLDLSIATRWAGGFIGPVQALAGHLAGATLVLLLLGLLHRRVTPQMYLVAALLVLLGPLGSFVILIAGLERPDSTPLPAVRDRADCSGARGDTPPPPVEAVYASLRQGRRPRASAASLTSYETVFLTADLPLQQQALAAISRTYRPEMRPALLVALSSNRPAVRVQAAAVFARLRGGYDERAKAVLAQDPSEMSEQARLAFADSCREIAASGFVTSDMAEKLLGLGAAPQLAQPRMRMQAGPRPAHGIPSAPDLAAPPRLKRYSCGGIA
jgi:hypothetical protein